MATPFQYAQTFNNGKAKNYQVIETDAVTMQAIIALAPKGQTVFSPTATGAVGTARVMPTSYIECLVVCADKVGAMFNSSFVNVKYGKSTLSFTDIKTACLGVVEVSNGSPCEKVSIKKFKTV